MQTSTILTQPADFALGTSFYRNELPMYIRKIKNDCGWKMGDLKSVVIENNSEKQIVLTAMQPNTEIDSSQKGEFTILQVLEGELKVTMHRESAIVRGGQKFTIYDHAKYKIESLSETFFLFLIAPAY
ncbi:MAG TPA: hypothetical protein VHO90_04890 [Bacteroidales bacterium]|nr:hypothetical protein [Bacteroidales bacterium]